MDEGFTFDVDPVTAAVAGTLDDVLADQMEANRRAARRADGIREVFALAHAHPEVYTPLTGAAGRQAADLAAAFDIAVRLRIPEPQIRSLAATASAAAEHLPGLWLRGREGFAPFPLIEATATAILTRLRPSPDAGRDATEASTAAIALVDDATSEWVLALTPAAFRARLRILIDRLDPRDHAARHTDALIDRRVVVEGADHGMSWLMVLMPTIDALAGKRRLTAAAKHLQKDRRNARTRDQIRADLAAAWLRGTGTPTAVKTKVFVTIPVGMLTGVTADHAGRCTVCGGTGRPEQATIVGVGTLDPLTAKQIFLDAKAYRRVLTDPFQSVVIDLERTTRHATTAQRDWLTLQHGTCTVDGCTRLALDSDIDHILPWSLDGPTDLDNLRPLCPVDHTRRHSTHLRYRPRPDGTTEVSTPTGFTTSEPVPPF